MEDHSPLSMDALFVTPERASADPTNPTPYLNIASNPPSPPQWHSTPSTSTRKRKAGVEVPPLHISTHSQPEQFATPVQGPPSAGVFGSQARGLRGGQRRTLQADQFSAPPQEVLAQLQEIPQLLQGGMSQLTQIVKDLARKHNALEKRVQELERENRVLKGQPSPPTPIQQENTMPLGYEFQAPQSALEDVYMDTDPRPRKKRSKNAMPMPGEAYGGPLYTQPNKSPGLFSGMITNNRQTAAPAQSPQTPRASVNGYRPLNRLDRGAAALKNAYRDA
ncbi:hypothetical protein Slin15195_G050850 [Septoria linicola]|uniref:Uncharacterized protein n=1 Tax=Septoria linicola TaxID=215465 RepID=A0A9Q9EHF5_9PEZI|nr:hypothetical protein Slin15195_G050850 [Septoria linicola]